MSTPTQEHVEAAEEIQRFLVSPHSSTFTEIGRHIVTEIGRHIESILAKHLPAHPPSGTAEEVISELGLKCMTLATTPKKKSRHIFADMIWKAVAPLLAPLVGENAMLLKSFEDSSKQCSELLSRNGVLVQENANLKSQLDRARKVVEENERLREQLSAEQKRASGFYDGVVNASAQLAEVKKANENLQQIVAGMAGEENEELKRARKVVEECRDTLKYLDDYGCLKPKHTASEEPEQRCLLALASVKEFLEGKE